MSHRDFGKKHPMPLKLRSHPDSLADVVSYALTHLSPPRTPSFNALNESIPGKLEPALPHPMYTLSWDALVAGQGLAAATHSGWRTLVLAGEQAWAAVECAADTSVDSAVVNQGPLVAATLDAVAAAEASPSVSGEVRLLEIPAIYTVALWVYSEVGSQLFVLAPVKNQPRSLQAYSEADFMSCASGTAIERLRACEVTPQPLPRIEQSIDGHGVKSFRILPPIKEVAVRADKGRPGRTQRKGGAGERGRPATLEGRS